MLNRAASICDERTNVSAVDKLRDNDVIKENAVVGMAGVVHSSARFDFVNNSISGHVNTYDVSGEVPNRITEIDTLSYLSPAKSARVSAPENFESHESKGSFSE